MTRRRKTRRPVTRPFTDRQLECFLVYAETGDQQVAADRLAISPQRLKANVGEYYRRIGANSGIQAAFLTWGPKSE